MSAFLLGTMIPYQLMEGTTLQTYGIGVVHWCSVRASVDVSQHVRLNVSGPSSNWILPTSINISRSGVATVIYAGNAMAVLNSMSSVSSGAGLPALKFMVSDAAGNVADGSENILVMRLRVICFTAAMYVC